MTIRELFAGIEGIPGMPPSVEGVRVEGLDYDSRRIERGFLFFAFAGARVDGRSFAGQAVERGAAAVVSELEAPEGLDVPWIRVGHGREVLALAARRFYGEPDLAIDLTGVTGTNGKTTTTFLIDAILEAAGRRTALVGTIEYRLAGRKLPAVNTTPESLDLIRLLDELRGAGGSHATMEVSSHALALRRVFGLRFHTAVFTNLTRDHLDFHRTMERYFEAKSTLFEGAGGPPLECAVLNADDEYAGRVRVGPSTRVLHYGIKRGNLRAENLTMGFDGIRFDLAHPGGTVRIESGLVGQFNVYNLLAAAGAGFALGFDEETVRAGLARCRAVPGRFERVEVGQPFLVVVDYAHTDDALRNVIAVARALHPRQVITVFGCGGDRDRAKRPLMGKAAAEGSDYVVLTSDNPRSEDPLAIMNDALVGVRKYDVAHAVEPDREKAIALALRQAREGDIVIIAGKGHEPYQEIQGVRHAFDDREAARRILRGFGFGGRAGAEGGDRG